MKQVNRDCKIVQDLLPNYIEGLTDEVTNQYIEEHIATCSECTNVLKAMQGDISVEEFDQEKEINYLKGIRKRVKRTIAIVSLLVVIIAVGIVLYVSQKSKLQITNYTFLRAKFVLEEEDTIDGNVYGTLIAVIDEKGKCKSVRMIHKGYTESVLQEKYNNFKTRNYQLSNLKLINNEIHFNINIWNGYTTQELKDYIKTEYSVDLIEEI